MTVNTKKITFIATGGTIDSVFDAPSERKKIKEHSGIPDYIRNVIVPHCEFDAAEPVMIDSLDMKDEHRQKILEAVEKVESKNIIITHGTDTMIDTALYLEKNLKDLSKTIIMVGSMIPLDGFYNSDAPFNLGYAMAQVQMNKGGIHLCMNAQCFTPSEVVKNREIGRFEFKDAS